MQISIMNRSWVQARTIEHYKVYNYWDMQSVVAASTLSVATLINMPQLITEMNSIVRIARYFRDNHT